MWFQGLIELLGGALLALGLFTRPVAFILSGNMAVAYFMGHASKGFFPLINGGPTFKHNEAFSFQIATDDQTETDRYWNAVVGNGGQESACGWCKDKWGVSWQITPRVLTDAMAAGGDEAKRAFDAMMTMKKIDVAAIEAARRG